MFIFREATAKPRPKALEQLNLPRLHTVTLARMVVLIERTGEDWEDKNCIHETDAFMKIKCDIQENQTADRRG